MDWIWLVLMMRRRLHCRLGLSLVRLAVEMPYNVSGSKVKSTRMKGQRTYQKHHSLRKCLLLRIRQKQGANG